MAKSSKTTPQQPNPKANLSMLASIRGTIRKLATVDKQLMTAGPKPSIDPAQRWPGGLVAFGYAFKQVSKNPQPALFVILLYMIAGIFASSTPIADTTDLRTILTDLMRDTSYYAVVNLILLLALPLYALSIADRKQVSLRDIFRPDGRRYLYVLLATSLASLAVIGSGFGLLVPVIWWMPWFYFGLYIAADKRVNPIAALRYSKKLTYQHKLKVWGLVGNVIMLSLVAALFSDIPRIGIALSTLLSAVVSVSFAGASAILYRWLQHQPSE